MYAIIKASGKQHKVIVGQELLLNHLDTTDKQITFTEVLLVADDTAITIGQPLVANATVEAEILGHIKGPKIRVAIYKAKSRYHKTKGYRHQLTNLKITKITA